MAALIEPLERLHDGIRGWVQEEAETAAFGTHLALQPFLRFLLSPAPMRNSPEKLDPNLAPTQSR